MSTLRAIIVFLLFIVAAYVLGAILAYPIKLAFDPVFDLEYRKYVTYATLLSGLIISGVYLRASNLLSFAAFGFSGEKRRYFQRLALAFLFGILLMLTIELLLHVLDIHVLDQQRSYGLDVFIVRLIKAVLVALLISLLEEAIFRGGLFAGLCKNTGVIAAVVLSSLLYAAVHFFRYQNLPADTEIGWLTGISMMPDAMYRFYRWSILDYFSTLFIFGVLLALLRLKFGSIAACIGVHAGVVTSVKLSDYYTNRIREGEFDYLVSPYNSTFGWLSFGVILLVVIFYLMKKDNRQLLF